MDLTERTVALLTATVALFGGWPSIRKVWRAYRARQWGGKWDVNIEAMKEVDSALLDGIEDMGCIRARILSVTNTDGVPGPLSPRLYSTAVWEAPRLPHETFSWDEELADNHLRDLYLKVLDVGAVDTLDYDIPPETILGRLYESSGVTRSLVKSIGKDEAKAYLLTLHFDHPGPLDREVSRNCVSRLRRAMRLPAPPAR